MAEFYSGAAAQGPRLTGRVLLRRLHALLERGTEISLLLGWTAREEPIMRSYWVLVSLVLAVAAQLIPGASADQCSNPEYSCDEPSPECWYNPARQEYACSPRGWNHCAASHQSYSCEPGTYCLGDGSAPPYCSQRQSLKMDRKQSRTVAATKRTSLGTGTERTATISTPSRIRFQILRRPLAILGCQMPSSDQRVCRVPS